nr:SPFH domain-containing protein [Vicinamibacterales bacterium]
MELLIVLFLAVMVLVVVATSLVVVPEGHVCLVERVGRFERALSPGVSIIVPFVDRVRVKVPLGERIRDLPAADAVSLDNRTVTLAGQVRYRVVDPRRAVYDVADYEEAVVTAAMRALRAAVGRVEASRAPGAVAETKVLERGETLAWGLEVLGIDATVSLGGAAMADLEERVQRERDRRILDHAAARGEGPGPDGRPTLAQTEAYEQYMAEVRNSPEYREALGLASGNRAADAVRRAARAGAAIAPGATGVVEENGRMWAARNVSDREILPRARCRIDGED